METLGSEQLADLAAYLRQRDFPVGAAQVLAAQKLLWRLAEQGISKPADELGPWLGPLFATSASEFYQFASLYKHWQTDLPNPDPKKPPSFAHLSLLLWCCSAALVVVATAGTWYYVRPDRQALSGNAQQAPGTTSLQPAPVAPSFVNMMGILLDTDNRPVSHARLLYAGKSSSESDASGKFTIAGRVSEPVLVTHCDYDAILVPLGGGSAGQLRMVRKARSACDSNAITPVARDQVSQYQRLRVGLSALPLIALLAWSAYVVWKRIGLRKWRSAATLQFAHLPLGDSADRLFSETELQRTVQEFRRSRPAPLREIWPEPTVNATVEQAGWFTPIYRARRRTAEYLVLIDRSGKRDQQAAFADDLIGRLKARGVYAQVYHFQSDPRTCSDPETGRSVSLTELSARLGQCEVWVVADSGIFFNVFTGRLEPWVDLLHEWPVRVLVTPVASSHWREHERRIADAGFEVLHASPRGLSRIVERLTGHRAALDPYPASLEDRRAVWLSNQPPPSRDIMRLRTELRLYLGRDGFRLLAACAEYPLIEWPLTLYLGNALLPEGTLGPVIRKLVRLPWFRRGSMPRWLRESLVRADRSLRKQVRNLLAARLDAMTHASTKRGPSEVDVAIQRQPSAAGRGR